MVRLPEVSIVIEDAEQALAVATSTPADTVNVVDRVISKGKAGTGIWSSTGHDTAERSTQRAGLQGKQ